MARPSLSSGPRLGSSTATGGVCGLGTRSPSVLRRHQPFGFAGSADFGTARGRCTNAVGLLAPRPVGSGHSRPVRSRNTRATLSPCWSGPGALTPAAVSRRVRPAERAADRRPSRPCLQATAGCTSGRRRQMLLFGRGRAARRVILLWRAADRLGLGPAAVEAATAAELLDIGRACPLPASARRVPRCIEPRSGEERRRAHAAWQMTPIRRLIRIGGYGIALSAVSGTDEDVADELERSAHGHRPGAASPPAAAFLTRAMELSAAPGRRGGRALAAARLTIDAGAPESAAELLRVAERSPLSDVDQAEVERLWAELAFTLTHGGEAPQPAATRGQSGWRGLTFASPARRICEALRQRNSPAGWLVVSACSEVAAAARPRPDRWGRQARVTCSSMGWPGAVPTASRPAGRSPPCLLAFRSAELPPEEGLRWPFPCVDHRLRPVG